MENNKPQKQSRVLTKFIKEIQYHNRNPKDLSALKLLDDTSTNPIIHCHKGERLFRSRIIHRDDNINHETGFYGFGFRDSFIPPRKKAIDLRANYRFIPYLYCSNNPYISIVEVRPRLGASVSVATIEVLEDLRLLDFTSYRKPEKMSQEKLTLFSELSQLFSEPVAEDDDVIDYVPTQFIAEYAKNLKYDGIVYKSSLVPEINNKELKRYNIVVFNYKKCTPIKSNVVRIEGNSFECCQVDEDDERIPVLSFYEEQMQKI